MGMSCFSCNINLYSKLALNTRNGYDLCRLCFKRIDYATLDIASA